MYSAAMVLWLLCLSGSIAYLSYNAFMLLKEELRWRKEQKKERAPKIIVVRRGPPKRSAVDILTDSIPMPKWKSVHEIMNTPKTVNEPKIAGPRKRRSRAQCKKSSRS